MDTKSLDVAHPTRTSAHPTTAPTAPSTTATSSIVEASSSKGPPPAGSWWRWTHGKSGSISSSSDTALAATASSTVSSHAVATAAATSHMVSGDLTNNNLPGYGASGAIASWGAMRWQKRTTRTGLVVREDGTGLAASTVGMSASTLSSSSSPKLVPSASFSSTVSGGHAARGIPSTATARKSAAFTTTRLPRDAAGKKKLSITNLGLQDLQLPPPVRDGKFVSAMTSSAMGAKDGGSQYADIKWSVGSGKRKVTRKGKKVTRMPVQPPRSSASSALSQEPRYGDNNERSPSLDVAMTDWQYSSSPTSTTSGSSVFSSTTSASPFSRPDPLVTCARAVLQDCIRQRCLDSGSMRKRTAEGRSKQEVLTDSKLGAYRGHGYKSGESGGLSCGSSSSDDELSQLSSLEKSRVNTKSDRDSEGKMTREELYRQLMLGEYDLSSSPDFECFSPLFEERGLPVEIRYQLPLALGTANETDKECPICQIRYGIGDHIVTLPCQHFFHACCVDKWLWNHTSCPLCRTEVTLDQEQTTKHQFTECSEMDQETIRRKMRSSSHSAGFRPLVPANVEVDELQRHIEAMTIQEEVAEANQAKYLVCPKPQRSQLQ